jgi:quercetin dioxygenase-like cupin family protein
MAAMMQRTATAKVPTVPVREGVTITPLRMAKGAGTFLMHYEAGTRCPAHVHPDGEEIYVISGKGRLDDLAIQAGDFIWTPPGEAHVLYAETEVLIHVTLPGSVVVTE